MGKIIKTEGLVKEFKVGNEISRVLDNISLEIEEGEFVTIMGPSGAGKSTLLYILGTLDKATSGNVFLNDADISKLNDKKISKIRRRELGFIFQFYNLVANLTVEDNVLLPVLLDGQSRKKYIKISDELLNSVGLYEKKKYTPRELSGGQQQRVAIARALMFNPKIIIADEPTGNLDSKTSAEIMGLLKNINQEKKKTIIMVTHEQKVASYGDRNLNIVDGRIV